MGKYLNLSSTHNISLEWHRGDPRKHLYETFERSKFGEWKTMLRNSGFGWDTTNLGKIEIGDQMYCVVPARIKVVGGLRLQNLVGGTQC